MEITTDQGIFKVDAEPQWNEFHSRFYAWGYRWIGTRKVWSKVKHLYSFSHWRMR